MSSKGLRAAGTDGSDFEHRETVAGRHKTSLKYKGYLKWATWAHIALWLLMALKLINAGLEHFDVLIPDIRELAVPTPILWEYIWILSIFPSIAGLLSLRHNRLGYLNVLYCGQPVVGILPILGASGWLLSDFVKYISLHKTGSEEMFLGYPTVWLWYIFFACALQTHFLQVYFAAQLRKAWDKSYKAK